MTYALGRRLDYADMPTVRAIVREAQAHDNRLSAFVLGDREEPGVPDEGSGRDADG